MNIDLTSVSVAIVSGVLSIVGIVLPLWIAKFMQDKQAAAVLGAAVKNSLGAIQQAATSSLTRAAPSIALPGAMVDMQPGIDYVLSHAGTEAARLGITPEAIAAKVSAQLGLATIAATVPVAVVTPVVPAPAVLPAIARP